MTSRLCAPLIVAALFGATVLAQASPDALEHIFKEFAADDTRGCAVGATRGDRPLVPGPSAWPISNTSCTVKSMRSSPGRTAHTADLIAGSTLHVLPGHGHMTTVSELPTMASTLVRSLA